MIDDIPNSSFHRQQVKDLAAQCLNWIFDGNRTADPHPDVSPEYANPVMRVALNLFYKNADASQLMAKRDRLCQHWDYLISQGACPLHENQPDPGMYIPISSLRECVSAHDVEGFAYLLGRVDPSKKVPLSPKLFDHVCRADNGFDFAKVMHQHGACVNTPTESGRWPLASAGIGGHGEMMHWMLDVGALVNPLDPNKASPLAQLMSHGARLAVVNILIENGADLARTEPDGLSLLDRACNLEDWSPHKKPLVNFFTVQAEAHSLQEKTRASTVAKKPRRV